MLDVPSGREIAAICGLAVFELLRSQNPQSTGAITLDRWRQTLPPGMMQSDTFDRKLSHLAVMGVGRSLHLSGDARTVEAIVDFRLCAQQNHPLLSTTGRGERLLHPALAILEPATDGTLRPALSSSLVPQQELSALRDGVNLLEDADLLPSEAPPARVTITLVQFWCRE